MQDMQTNMDGKTAENTALEATLTEHVKAIKACDREIKQLKQQVETLEKKVPTKKRPAAAPAASSVAAKQPRPSPRAVVAAATNYFESSASEDEAPPAPSIQEKKKRNQSAWQERWDTRYKELLDFKEQHGHCNVSKAHPEFKTLLIWTRDQRTRHRWTREGRTDGMDPERIRRLRDIGFQFQIAKHDMLSFGERFQQLEEYKQ